MITIGFSNYSVTTKLIFSFLYSLVAIESAQAQVIPDRSLGNENSTVTPNTTINETQADLIEGGAIRDSNLFHSFSEFNVNNGGAVYFASPDGIENILTRVTGNNVSNIFGTLGTNGTANLFLLNPNGIIFGDNAALDVSGSFLATTAESFVFGTEDSFSATDPNTAPLLNLNLTPGLQMGKDPSKITVQNNGHLLAGGVFFPLQNISQTTGLQIDANRTLGLVGGEIELDGAIIKTVGGNIDLVSVERGKIDLDFNATGDRFDASQVREFGDIKLSNKALLDASGVFTGNISLQGKNIRLEDASAAIIQNFGTENSGSIAVRATGSIDLSGTVRNIPDVTNSLGLMTGVTSSRFTTETLGSGKGGDVSVKGNSLYLYEGSSISARSYGSGNTGDLNIAIDESININASSPLNPSIPTFIATTIFYSGNSGEINVTAENINLTNGGSISSLNFGSGRGGNVSIDVVDELKLSGFDPISINPSTLGSTVYRTGDSSNVTIDVSKISLLDGGKISTATLAQGDAGQLTINATDYIKVGRTTTNGRFESSIASDAEILPPVLQQLLRVPSLPSGNSGDITIDTPNLVLFDDGEVAVNNQGSGDSGSLKIKSDRIQLNTNANITAFSASGQGGNIEIQVSDLLSLNNNSAITAQTTAEKIQDRFNINGGNINIDTDIVTLIDNSQINASATEGNGGNINITTQGLFISSDSLVSASSEFGLDGTVEVETISSDRPIALTRLSSDLIDATEHITTGCNSNSDFAIAGKGGLPTNPTQNLRGRAVWQDVRLFSDSGNNTKQAAANEPSNSDSTDIVEAKEWKVNRFGKVELVAINGNGLSLNNQTSCH